MNTVPAGADVSSTSSPVAGPPSGACCAECAARGAAARDEYVYAIGRLEVRFPSLGIEREFQQRQAQLGKKLAAEAGSGPRIRQVLEANRYLMARMCYVLTVSNVPVYIVAPTAGYLRDDLLDAIAASGDPTRWVLVIGRRGPIAQPSACAGIMAPILAADQIFNFTIEEWAGSLEAQAGRVFEGRKADRAGLGQSAKELFGRIVSSTENLGATDAQRALNYVAMQHPGPFIAVAERAGRATLERLETRLIHGLGTRRQVAVILTFVDLTTGVPERLFTRIDVTEEWPFVVDRGDGGRAPLGLLPFVENELTAHPR